jgi:hypothetical protein
MGAALAAAALLMLKGFSGRTFPNLCECSERAGEYERLMPRYFFHLYECGTMIPEDEGRELSGPGSIRDIALREARDVMAGEVKAGSLCLSCRIEVMDDVDEMLRVDATLSKPQRVLTEDGEKRELTSEEYSAYQERAGRYIREGALFAEPEW